jgi:hypothetical protein
LVVSLASRSLDFDSLDFDSWDFHCHTFINPACDSRVESIARFDPTPTLPYVTVDKYASPNSQARGQLYQSFRLPKQAQVFRVIFQAQYQAFVRFAVGSSAAL